MCLAPYIRSIHFFKQIFNFNNKSRIYIEYQNLEWIAAHRKLEQISDGRVNYFSSSSIDSHFNVLKIGRVRNYGAAGKGMLFAYDLKKLGLVYVVAFDETSFYFYWNKFLKSSEVQMLNPTLIMKLGLKMDLIVMNPNQYNHAKDKYENFSQIHKKHMEFQ